MTAARMRRILAAWLLLAFAGAGFTAFAQGVLPVPALSARVIDQTGTLDAAQRDALDAKLAAFEKTKGSQIVMLMVPTTAPEDIASYANRIGNAWKIGRKDVGDGILVIVAKDDRKMRIEVAKTLEGAVPDLAAAHIIDDAMKPRFQQNDFAGGLNAAADQLIARVGGEPLPDVKSGDFDGNLRASGFNWQDLGIFLFIAVLAGGPIARSVLGKVFGSLALGGVIGVVVMVITSSLVIAVLAGLGALLFTLLGSAFGGGPGRGGGFGGGMGGMGGFGGGFGGRGGGGFGGGGGGGFGSGGGGNFGGGGASGSW